jgi:hypothetical protein
MWYYISFFFISSKIITPIYDIEVYENIKPIDVLYHSLFPFYYYRSFMRFCKDLLSVLFQTIYPVLFSNGRASIHKISTAHISDFTKVANISRMYVPTNYTRIFLISLSTIRSNIGLILIDIILSSYRILEEIYQREPKEPFQPNTQRCDKLITFIKDELLPRTRRILRILISVNTKKLISL